MFSAQIRLGVFAIGALALATAWTRAQGLSSDPPYVSTQDSWLQQADELEQSQRFQEAIPIYENMVHDGDGRDARWTAYILFRLACDQAQVGDRNGAMESAGVAASLDPAEPSYKAFLADLSSKASRRARSAVYHAHRDQGSAGRLLAENGILHIFVRGRNVEPWTTDDVRRLATEIQRSDDWIQQRKKEAGPVTPLTFEHRYLALADEPFWRRVDVPDADTSADYRKAWLQAVLVRFGAASYRELFDRVFEGHAFKNRCVIFHASKDDISLSIFIPYRKLPTDLESTFVRTQASEWITPYDSVTYAHELLHLYGADDLFNKVSDPAIPETEIMNFGAHQLDDCVMSPVTRYAIGWTDRPPELTRLRLEESGGHPKKRKGAHG